MSIKVKGAEDFVALARALRAAGNKDLQRELDKGLERAAKPFTKAVRKSALQTLPRGGGLNARVANSRISVRKSTGRRSQGIRIVAGGRRSELKRIDAGRVRHPVFGNREEWVTEHVRPGFWTRPAEAVGPQVTAEAQKALQRVADKVGRL